MARMIPPRLSPDVKSTGERQLFELLKTDPGTGDWVVLHSLGLARHTRRLHGEIDFVVLIPGEGVFCLEVKAGSVSRRAGEWSFTNRYGEQNTSPRSPFAQVSDAMHSLRKEVQRVLGKDHPTGHVLFGYGVMFPHVSFAEEDPEWEGWQIYDRDSARLPVSNYLRELARGWHAKMGTQRWYRPSGAKPTERQVAELLAVLRRDFDLVASPRDLEHNVEGALLALTEEQYDRLDAMEDNPRCLFEGGAGTGKTFLAREFARRMAADGKSVLLLCYNRMLGKWLAEQTRTAKLTDRVTAASFHAHLEGLITGSKHRDEFRRVKDARPPDLFDAQYPRLALAAIAEGKREPFDVLVIDEGQDLIRREYLQVLDKLVKGGLGGGRWTIFCDFQRQAIYSQFGTEEMQAMLAEHHLSYARGKLHVNCRNTKPIGEETALLSGFEKPPFRLGTVAGRPVAYDFAQTPADARRLVEEQVASALKDGLEPHQITLLSPVTREKSCLAGVSKLAGRPLHDLADQPTAYRPLTSVGHATIHAFKGLESPAVILHDIDRINDDQSRSLLYVGMSRARERLAVVLSDACMSDYQTAIQRSIARSLAR